MSKEGHACKVTSVCKHKERKPKKPHYIPRPWGKPYNYKCFQCPFTCMEKSHLYNHMKYSLCKNSLSLLIESDWPYKKGNLLHPDQIRPLQQERGQGEGAEVNGMTRESSNNRNSSEGTTKRASKGPEPELLMPRVGSSIPCYPLPPGLVDYQDPTGLNLSVLGVGYPLSPSLFSYVNSMNLAQLPFLASAAQLMQPASGAHHPADRSLLPPHFYYPFLCEHAFGAASVPLPPPLPPGCPPRESHQTLPTGQGTSLRLQPRRGSQAGASRGQGPPWGPTSPLWRRGQPLEPTSAAALLSDLSKALQEYQEAERKIAHLEKEDLPAQGHLWEHLNKIRSELSHIHHALERTARQSEGPLDLSVKKEHPGVTNVVATGDQGLGGASLKDNITMETEEEDEETKERDEEEKENERRKEAMKASLESRKQSLDVLIKMSQVGVKTEVLSSGRLGLRPSQAEGLWPGRTTKCEADSSVLLCPDGRPLAVFNDFPTFSTKNSKRPSSIQQLREPQCQPSPLTTIDS
uniref:Zinc finger protein 750-like zinc finger domain-containing protein n=1 Tax=Oncorhynchus tshawytscha TaxID=74940 RepID=A0A8C8CLE9_ONCTS